MSLSPVFVSVQKEDFSLQHEMQQLQSMLDERGLCGAVVSFTGVVRGEGIRSLELEHYAGMTERSLEAIAREAVSRFTLGAIRIVHRIGLLLPGENIVCVVVAAPHRQEAFDGASFAMDYLKTQAPFWKKETTLKGASHWVSARDSDDRALKRWQEEQVRP